MPKQPSKKSKKDSPNALSYTNYESFTLAIVVKDKKSNAALSNHFVEAWFHHTDRADELLGTARTNSDGYCAITFQWDAAVKNPQISPVYCKILRGDTLLYNSLEDSKSWWLVMNHVDILLYAPEQGSIQPVLGIPLSTAHLNNTLNDLSTFSEAERVYILSKLEQALKDRALETLNVQADKAKEVIAPIRVDIAAVKDQTLNQLVQTVFLPVLKADCKTSDLFKEIPVQEKPAQDGRTVKEVLQLDLKLGEHPVFNADVRKLKTHVLSKTAGISPDIAVKLADNPIPLESASEQDWQKLVDAGTITGAQKTALRYNFRLSKITGNNFDLVDKIYQDRLIKEAKDLVRWEAADWTKALQNSGGKTPNGESAEDYVKTMLKVVQRNFPSAFFIERKVQRSLPTNTILKELEKLHSANAKQQKKAVTTEGVDISKSPTLKSVANTYKHLGIETVFTDSQKTPQEKVEILQAKQGHLQTFVNNNPQFDLRTGNFFEKDAKGNSTFNYTNIPQAEQAQVRNQMMSFQRVGRLAPAFEAQEVLLAEGFDSSASIVNTAPKSLRQTLGNRLGAATFNQIVAAAHAQFNVSVHTTAAIRGIDTSRFVGFRVENYPKELINQLQDIDGYSEMFGSQDYCECDHCKSIFGPAAYFVDLMRFIDDNVHFWKLTNGIPTTYINNSDTHPISLNIRRPDLWRLELSCENTNSVLPYLQIINEIKESYIQNVMASLREQAIGATDVWKELSLLPIVSDTGNNDNSGGIAFRNGVVGTTWKNGLRTAYNRPFEESQILLDAMGLRYVDVLTAFNISAPERLNEAYLGASYEEYQMLKTSDTNINDLRDLRFGFPKETLNGFHLAFCPVAPFLRATGLSREEMEFLLSDASQLHSISTTVRLSRTPVNGDIQSFTERIFGLNNPAVLDFIHRFLRLKRLLGWTIRELDLVIKSLNGITYMTIDDIARMREVQRVLDISVEETIALCREIPTTSIYKRTVRNEFLNLSVDEPVPSMLDRLFDITKIPISDSSNIDMLPDALISNGQLPYLLKGLGTNEADYRRIFKFAFQNNAGIKLTLINVSKCYRLIRLAKIWGISLEEFLYLLDMTSGDFAISPGRILILHKTMERIRKLPLSISEMKFIATDSDDTYVSKISSAYVGDEGTKAVEKWLKKWIDDPRHYISVADLQEYLPPQYRESHITVFITALTNRGVLLNIPNLGCRVVKMANVVLSDIPEKVHLSRSELAFDAQGVPVIDPSTGEQQILIIDFDEITLDNTQRQDLVVHLNNTFTVSSIRQKTVNEHLGLQFKTDATRIEAMSFWYDKFGVTVNTILSLLNYNSGIIDPTALAQIVDLFKNFERIDLLFSKLKLETADVEWLNTHIVLFILGNNDTLSNLNTIDEFLRLADYKRFKNAAGDETSILRYHTALLESKPPIIPPEQDEQDAHPVQLPPTWFIDYADILSKVLGCEEGQLKALKEVELTTTLSTKPIEDLINLERLVQLATPLSIWDATTLKDLKENTYDKALQYEKALRAAFRAKYSAIESYEKAYEPLEERINEMRRDVLCSFLLALDQQNKFHDTGDLYAYFLVDVEMSGCAKVSRILAATLTLQTYLHRVLMGLETSAENPQVQAFLGKVKDIDEQKEKIAQWEWMKNYRVWEANRKVFLYPENWIEPELRDDKSPLFRTLEDELLQQKISLESAEGAYSTYMKGFSEIGNLTIAGVYYEDTPETSVYHILGRTEASPYQYYYRKMIIIGKSSVEWVSSKKWTAWEKVELAIESPYVTPVIYHHKIHLFWVSDVTIEKSKFSGGNSEFEKFEQTFSLSYSYLGENGKWLQPQKLKEFFKGVEISNLDTDNKEKWLSDFENSITRYRLFPKVIKNNISIDYRRGENIDISYRTYLIDFFNNKANDDGKSDQYYQPNNILLTLPKSGNDYHLLYLMDYFWLPDTVVMGQIEFDCNNTSLWGTIPSKELAFFKSNKSHELRFVFNNISDNFFRVGNQQFLIRHKEDNENLKTAKFINEELNYAFFPSNREAIRIGTNVISDLQKIFYIGGLTQFLTLKTQKNHEPLVLSDGYPEGVDYELAFDSQKIASLGVGDNYKYFSSLDFSGSTGLYFSELFFHIPFLIADHLNAEGKYKDADYWYRKIFDPTGTMDEYATVPEDRYWQYLEFRNQTMPKLIDMLTDAAAIDAYKNDPFNPHAIARLRTSAYMKSIVMKYVDNLIDWGDSLFRRDTWEANSEALMLYTLAYDILGERPQKLGKCESAIETENCGCAEPVTYSQLMANPNQPPFIYYIENVVPINAHSGVDNPIVQGDIELPSGNNTFGYEDYTAQNTSNNNVGTRDLNETQEALVIPDSFAARLGQQAFISTETNLVFCIPNNEKMLDYWDRVEDRLFKLRHCMNIDGVKRSLALFQPPIDPALLVAAFAAGLTIEDILNNLYGSLPAYRFTYLVEKAKAFAGTVQSFGGALLSALEKKDEGELTLLRSTHEQNLLKLTKEVKKKAIEEAKANLQSTVEGMMNTMNRIIQYTQWIEQNLNGWERTQQVSKHTASVLSKIEPILRKLASTTHLTPQLGALTALKYGGKEIGDSIKAAADAINSAIQLAELVSSSAGIEASFQRRKQEWEFQKKTAEQELKQVQQQIAAATIRLAIAEKDLEIHEKQIEQAAEVHDFYKNKFTGLGLYNYLANTLNNLHSMAFNAAMDMAKQAEAAYKFETGDDTYTGISGGTFWDASRVGLLSGEQITLGLQELESNFINWNRRHIEIRQSFSMLMIDPDALIALRKDGTCTFKIPEWAFDLQYPGHYHRRLVSSSITMPCVVGPYTNVAATLTMTKSSLRKEAKNANQAAEGFIFKGSSMVATSSANNDGGQFDLNFRDERFLPFEGAGAVDSEWVLELPKDFRSFDYNTISDVIFHLSYRSKYDGAFKTSVESNLPTAMGTLKRLVSLRQEFPDILYELETGTNSKTITFSKNHFPYVFNNRINVIGLSVSSSGSWEKTVNNTDIVDGDVVFLLEYTIS